MKDITISLEGVLWVLGFIVTAGGAIKVIQKLNPFKKIREAINAKAEKEEFELLKKEFAQYKKEHETLKEYQSEDHDKLKTLEKGNEVICKCMLALTDHELTGNGQEQLKKAKEEMHNYLISK